MKQRMAEFLLEMGNLGLKTQFTFDAPGTIFNPYNQFPKFRPSGLSAWDKHMIRQFGTRYNLGSSDWTKPGMGHAGMIIASKAAIPATAVASVAAASYVEGQAVQEIVENESIPTQDKIRWLVGW